MRYSVVGDIISTKRIQFFDEHSVEIFLCDSPNPKFINFINPFRQPFLKIDIFARQKLVPKIKYIDIEELKKLGFALTVTRVGKKFRWFANQQAVYRIEDISNCSPGSKKLNYIPTGHKIAKDIANNRVRIEGRNAGYPHSHDGGPWLNMGGGEIKER